MAIKEYRGYQSYHGRMPGWKKAVIAILVLILICALIFILVQRNRVFDSNGSHIKLPFGGKNDPPVSDTVDEDPGKDDDLIIDIQEPESKVTELHGVTIDAAALQTADFSALQADQRPVVTVKAANGTVLYGSLNDTSAAMVREKIAGRNAVARISCFADTRAADGDNTMAVMSVSGKAWRDPNGNAWLDPYSAEATAYLVNIAKECAQLGFTEIVLEDVQFPTYGIVKRITYGDRTDTAESRKAAVNAFLDAVRQALDGQNVTVSVALPSSLLAAQTDDTAGWDLSEIVRHADRIYMDAADQNAADSARAAISALYQAQDASAAKGTDAALCFVAETAAPITGGSYVIS